MNYIITCFKVPRELAFIRVRTLKMPKTLTRDILLRPGTDEESIAELIFVKPY
jgi:hypothetical protein